MEPARRIAVAERSAPHAHRLLLPQRLNPRRWLPRGAASALHFIVRQQWATDRPPRLSSLALALPDALIEADLYLPIHARCAAESLGTILVLHGMSAGGNRDPRIVNLARATAVSGYTVVAPDFDDVRNATIDPRTIDRFAATIAAVAGDDALAPSGRVAIMTASFSGSLALLAASRPAVAEHVAALCTVGSFGDIDSVLEFLMTAPHADPYGRLIVLKHFFSLTMPDDPRIRAALTIAVRDSAGGGDPALPRYLRLQSDGVRHTVRRMLYDAEWRRRWVREMLPRMAETRAAPDVVGQVHGLRAPAFLLHGAGDNVIPATQTTRIAAALARAGRPHRALVTPFVSHGDATLSLRLVADVVRLLRGFSYFFGHVA